MAPELVRRIDRSFDGATTPQLGYQRPDRDQRLRPRQHRPDYVARPTSTGPPVHHADPHRLPVGEDVEPDAVGEVLLSGPMLIRCYWNRPEATAEAIVDGWLHTGDLGYLDDEGFLYLVDRAKDMVLRAGENVYCAEVEAAIHEHPAVHEVAVFGLPHERLGEEVTAAVQPRPGATIDLDQMQAFLEERIARFMVPTRWFVRDEPLHGGPPGRSSSGRSTIRSSPTTRPDPTSSGPPGRRTRP